MRLAIYILILFLSNINLLVAKTFISQDITQNQYWTQQKSPYIITNDITIHAHVILNIQAGTEIQFSSGVTLYVEGSIWAVGKSKKPIIWHGFQDNNWNGIVFRKGKEKNNIDTTINVFRYCQFEGKDYIPAQLILAEARHIEMENCKIQACQTALQSEKSGYIYFKKSKINQVYKAFHICTTSSMKIEQCKIENFVLMLVNGSLDFKFNKINKSIARGQHTGLVIWLIGGGSVVIENNEFKQAAEAAFTLYKSVRKSNIQVANNQFKKNKIHIALSCQYANKGDFKLKDNTFYKSRNTPILILDDCIESIDTISLSPNYFVGLQMPKQAHKLKIEHENNSVNNPQRLILEFEGFLKEKPKFTPLKKI